MILQYPDERVTTVCNPVAQELYPQILDLLHKEVELLRLKGDGNCVGLAANQVGIIADCFIWKNGNEWEEAIHPSYTPLSSRSTLGSEGCLSLKNEPHRAIQRFEQLNAVYTDRQGKHRNRILEGMPARIFQHETEHTYGRLINVIELFSATN